MNSLESGHSSESITTTTSLLRERGLHVSEVYYKLNHSELYSDLINHFHFSGFTAAHHKPFYFDPSQNVKWI